MIESVSSHLSFSIVTQDAIDIGDYKIVEFRVAQGVDLPSFWRQRFLAPTCGPLLVDVVSSTESSEYLV